MKDRSHLTDEKLENILTGYFNRNAPKTFAADLQSREAKHIKTTSAIKYSSIGVCTAALLAVGILSGQISNLFTNNSISVDNPTDGTSSVFDVKQNSFIITAYADEEKTPDRTETEDKTETDDKAGRNSAHYTPKIGILGGSFVTVTEGEEYIGTDGYSVNPELYDGEYTTISVPGIGIVSDYIKFDIEGNNIVSYSAVCRKGNLGYNLMAELTDSVVPSLDSESADYYYSSSSDEADVREYTKCTFVSGDTGIKSTGTLGYASEEECKFNRDLNTISWHPSHETLDKFFMEYADEISMYDDEKGVTGENLVKYGEFQKKYVEKLNSSVDEYNDMFADTITITVNYADGSSESKDINVTFDENHLYVVDVEN